MALTLWRETSSRSARSAWLQSRSAQDSPACQRVPGAAYCGSFRADGIAKRDLAETAEGIAFVEPGGPQLRAIGYAHFAELDDPEISYRFGDLRDGKYWSFVHASPLWPDTRYTRIG